MCIRPEEGGVIVLEREALKLGSTIATHAAKYWLQRRKATYERSASLAELAQAELKGLVQRRKLENLVERIGHQVAEQLAPVLEQRFSDVPDHEAEAAILAVVYVLEDVDLSDRALLANDADPEVLAKQIRRQFPQRSALLSERAAQLHELALDQACRHLVQVVRYLPTFPSAALGEVLTRLTAQAEALDELLSRTPTTSLYAPRGVDRDEEFRVEYLSRLATTFDRLELLGLPGDDQPTLALTVAYLSLSASDGHTRRRRTASRTRPDLWEPAATEGLSVEAAIGDEHRVLLRGDAGSGKTTLLHWLAVQAARRALTGALTGWNDTVPFVVLLRMFAEGDLPRPEQFVGLSTPVVADLAPEAWTHRVLQAGRGLLLVDGVDEVPAGRRRAVKAWLRDLLDAYPGTRVVVTSRTAAADAKWLAGEGFRTVTLEPMSPVNILDFVERWHRAAELTGAEVTAAERRLRAQLERPHLRQLAASPLLCAMLCALNLSHRSELPRNRMELYAKALAMLLHLRDAERGIETLLTDTGKRVLLRDLAWRLTLGNKVELSTEEALGHLSRKLPAMPDVEVEPEAIFTHLLERSGVLRQPVPGRVDFVHRTFLEYLAAEEAVQQHHIDTLIAHAHLDTWWETVVMACGHATAKQAEQLLTGVLDEADRKPKRARRLRLIAAASLETVRDVDPAVRDRIDAVVRDRLIPPRKSSEARSLASIGPRLLRYLPADLGQFPEMAAAATVEAAVLAGAAEAMPLLASYVKDERSEVRRAVILQWKFFDPEQYAKTVLAHDLGNSYLEVPSPQFLPQVLHIGRFGGLGLSLRRHRKVDLAPLAGREGLRGMNLFGLYQADVDLSVLSTLPDLDDLFISGFDDSRLSGIDVLHGIRKVTLFSCVSRSLSQAARVFGVATDWNIGDMASVDLADLIEVPLRSLIIQHSAFDSIEPLVAIRGLKRLWIDNDVQFDYDLGPLAELELENLAIDAEVEYRGLDRIPAEIVTRRGRETG
ncbi:NACHT domain-containing protein [Saccharothrix variisporea]|uniref:NACHT domain-containing protein n=1 Tax=Saccharothrix variisporea TaxID=543527 RepID=A0A495XAI1_9PSEU|nr:NACHT domain-containing protein [Saccharothrix variisporea]RKT71491.1 NACHT domain-containing protein [Saccharothrix variisporea]